MHLKDKLHKHPALKTNGTHVHKTLKATGEVRKLLRGLCVDSLAPGPRAEAAASCIQTLSEKDSFTFKCQLEEQASNNTSRHLLGYPPGNEPGGHHLCQNFKLQACPVSPAGAFSPTSLCPAPQCQHLLEGSFYMTLMLWVLWLLPRGHKSMLHTTLTK